MKLKQKNYDDKGVRIIEKVMHFLDSGRRRLGLEKVAKQCPRCGHKYAWKKKRENVCTKCKTSHETFIKPKPNPHKKK